MECNKIFEKIINNFIDQIISFNIDHIINFKILFNNWESIIKFVFTCHQILQPNEASSYNGLTSESELPSRMEEWWSELSLPLTNIWMLFLQILINTELLKLKKLEYLNKSREP